MTDDRLPAETRIGRVGLRVGDAERLARFYRDVIGLDPLERGDRTSLRAGDATLLELIEDPDAPARPRTAAGLFHVAIRVPDRDALADAFARIGERWELEGTADHRVSEALYLSDPEGNGIEIYRDRPRERWPRTDDGRAAMTTEPLDRSALDGDADAPLAPGTDLGHVHLETADLDRARAFYADGVGFEPSAAYDGAAAFLAAGGYHHHLALNAWNGRTEPAGDHRGLEWFEVVVPDETDVERAVRRLDGIGAAVERDGRRLRASDPDGVELRMAVD